MYLIEGFAAYMETINSDGGRLRDTYWEMLMRADFVNGQIITRDQAAEQHPLARFTGDAPYYLYGAYFCDYLARTYWQDKLFEIMKENSQGIALFINDTFVHVLGKPLPQVWDDFIAEAKATYTQQADAINAQGLTAMKRITHTGEYAISPAFSPDGSQIAYAQGGPRLTAAIRGVKIDGTFNHTVVTADTVYSGESLSWSPDGTKLVYGRTDYVGLQSFADLYLFDLQTGQERRLTYGLRADGPTWSPDGQTIVFVAKKSLLQTSLMAMDADGSHLRALVVGKDEMQFSSPHFSPDGQRIAVEALAFGGYDDIYLLNADGSDLHALTQDRAKDFAPQWSPDGGYILFNSDRSGVNNIYAYRLSDGQLLQATNVLYGAFSPTMSADGKTIAFVAYDSPTGFDVYTMSADPNSWKPIAFHLEELPKPPNYAEFAKGYAIRPYSPFETLLPHFWQPILLLGELGATTQAEDALGQTSYGATAGFTFGGPPEFSLSASHTLSDLATNGLGGPAPPSVGLRLTPRMIRSSGFFPLMQSLRSSQTLNLSATYGLLGTLQTEEGPMALQGLQIDGEWQLELNGGRDDLRSSYTLALNGGARLTEIGTQLSWGARGTAVWQLSGDYLLQTELALDPATLSGTGEVDVQFPVIHIEKELGTWPIYFDRILLSGSVQGDVTRQGMALSTYKVSVILPTILWYRFEIDPQVGVVIGAAGQVQPSFSLGF